MPGPMPPQGPPQGQPPGQGAPQGQSQSQPQGGGGGVPGLMMSVDKAIDHLKLALDQAKGVTPEEKKMIAAVDEIYGQLLGSLGMPKGEGGQDEDDEEGGQGQTTDPMAGGNSGAVPAY